MNSETEHVAGLKVKRNFDMTSEHRGPFSTPTCWRSKNFRVKLRNGNEIKVFPAEFEQIAVRQIILEIDLHHTFAPAQNMCLVIHM